MRALDKHQSYILRCVPWRTMSKLPRKERLPLAHPTYVSNFVTSARQKRTCMPSCPRRWCAGCRCRRPTGASAIAGWKSFGCWALNGRRLIRRRRCQDTTAKYHLATDPTWRVAPHQILVTKYSIQWLVSHVVPKRFYSVIEAILFTALGLANRSTEISFLFLRFRGV